MRVTFRGETRTAEGGADGWRVTFPPAQPKGTESLTVDLGGCKKVLKDVRVGEVFLAAAESHVGQDEGKRTAMKRTGKLVFSGLIPPMVTPLDARRRLFAWACFQG